VATPVYTMADVMTSLLTAIQDILGEVMTVIAQNAPTIATVLVIGGLAFLLVRYGTRIFRGIVGFFRAMF